MNEMKPSVEIAVDLELRDLLRANLWFLYGKWSTRIFLLLLGLLAIGACVAIASSTERTMAALVLLFCVAYGGLLPVIVWFNTRRTYSSLKEFQKQLKYRFTRDGYDVEDGKSSARVSWDSMLRAKESKHSFNLFFHRVLFYAIPKRCFSGQADVEVMREILKQALETKASLRLD